jgi:hypothetical protein
MIAAAVLAVAIPASAAPKGKTKAETRVIPPEHRNTAVQALPRKFQPACAPSDTMNAKCGMGAARGD